MVSYNGEIYNFLQLRAELEQFLVCWTRRNSFDLGNLIHDAGW
ncbi:MAG: hypothetical protein ACREF6_22295 [Alphaproteobacteria bacterium]